jgi:hypothetical protein
MRHPSVRPVTAGALAVLLVWAAAGPASLAQQPTDAEPTAPTVVEEVEPNDDTREIADDAWVGFGIGDTVVGTFSDRRDRDFYRLQVDADTIVDLEFHVLDGPGGEPATDSDVRGDIGVSDDWQRLPIVDGRVLIRRFAIAAGTYPLDVRANRADADTPYRLVIRPSAPPPADDEQEPNHSYGAPGRALTVPGRVSGEVSFVTDRDFDVFTLTIVEPGVKRMTFRSAPQRVVDAADAHADYDVRILPESGRGTGLFQYLIDDVAHDYVFFPVLDAGTYLIAVRTGHRARFRDAYTIEFAAATPRSDDALEAKVREAIARAEAWMLAPVTGEEAEERLTYPGATYGALLAALAETEPSPERDARIAEGVAAISAMFDEPEVEWHGREVRGWKGVTYEAAIAALGLAECRLAGIESVEPALRLLTRYLLASQITPERPTPWEPVPEDHEEIGGWRYSADADDGDLSVTGWCVIALFAADVAGIDEPGIERALVRGTRYALKCTDRDGFQYQIGRGSVTGIGQSIGALLLTLFGEDHAALRVALDVVDRNLCAGTQTADPSGHANSIFYYWYYATRLCYLRGGIVWERWRAITMQQLLRTQLADGRWPCIRAEESAGDRYATAMATIILRLCLNHPPAYLALEVEAF